MTGQAISVCTKLDKIFDKKLEHEVNGAELEKLLQLYTEGFEIFLEFSFFLNLSSFQSFGNS